MSKEIKIFGEKDARKLSSIIKEELAKKVDIVEGKQLSTNDYTDNEKTKLSGIAEGAEENVQSDWSQTDTTADDYIKNKPELYSKTEIDSLISSASHLKLQVADELPTASEDVSGTIYLVSTKSSEDEEENVYTEYISVGTGDPVEWRWEKLGEAQVDLSNYATKEDIEGKLDVYPEVVNVGESVSALSESKYNICNISASESMSVSLGGDPQYAETKGEITIEEGGSITFPDDITIKSIGLTNTLSSNTLSEAGTYRFSIINKKMILVKF